VCPWVFKPWVGRLPRRRVPAFADLVLSVWAFPLLPCWCRFIAGTSATLFNQAFLSLNSSTADSIIVSAVQEVLQNIGEAENDVAVYPNSFHGWNEASNPVGAGGCQKRSR
jgi:hypothetical protein